MVVRLAADSTSGLMYHFVNGVTMAHRLMSGEKISDLAAAKRRWRRDGRSPKTYCNLGEWRKTREYFGKLVVRLPNGAEIRRHATLKDTARGGSPLVAHNRVIVGYKGEWTYYADSDLVSVTVRTVLWMLVPLPEEFLTSVVVEIAEGLRREPDVSVLPIYADALQDAGYGVEENLAVLRSVKV